MIPRQMYFDGTGPDSLSFPFFIKECMRRLDDYVGRSIHGQGINSGLYGDLFVQTSLHWFLFSMQVVECCEESV
ncbi:hypothetical protein SLEP1_g26976 [Rubroshorea leprosula]|uniref:Uncharacterized protein n=1 Tax=Rubroshorea leprosula TaxID=152421 RepID=A0AAV5JUY7_9ROSI|nr:hypothetical protein SLEP1_g26976 [Rubroshorea leprosula]